MHKFEVLGAGSDPYFALLAAEQRLPFGIGNVARYESLTVHEPVHHSTQDGRDSFTVKIEYVLGDLTSRIAGLGKDGVEALREAEKRLPSPPGSKDYEFYSAESPGMIDDGHFMVQIKFRTRDRTHD